MLLPTFAAKATHGHALATTAAQGTYRYSNGLCWCLSVGIYVNDILEAVPIDKYFELFKPNAGGEGGFIRICMNFVRDLAELDNRRPGRAGHLGLWGQRRGVVARGRVGAGARAGQVGGPGAATKVLRGRGNQMRWRPSKASGGAASGVDGV